MWVKIKQDIVHSEKGFLEADKNYNLPQELAEEFIENKLASKTNSE